MAEDLITRAKAALADAKAWCDDDSVSLPVEQIVALQNTATALIAEVESLRAQQRAPVSEPAAEAIRAALDRFEGRMTRILYPGGGALSHLNLEMRALRNALHVVFMGADVEAPPPRQPTPPLPPADETDARLLAVLRTWPEGSETHTLAVACLGLRQSADELATAVQKIQADVTEAQQEIRNLQTCGELGGHRG